MTSEEYEEMLRQEQMASERESHRSRSGVPGLAVALFVVIVILTFISAGWQYGWFDRFPWLPAAFALVVALFLLSVWKGYREAQREAPLEPEPGEQVWYYNPDWRPAEPPDAIPMAGGGLLLEPVQSPYPESEEEPFIVQQEVIAEGETVDRIVVLLHGIAPIKIIVPREQADAVIRLLDPDDVGPVQAEIRVETVPAD